MKARGAKWIRYPCSPSSKHCTLNISASSRGISAVGKPESVLPGKYSRKAETWRNRRGSTTTSDAYGSIRFYTVNLTRTDSRMKVSLKGLPDTLRGDAGSSSACVVRWPVKSGNRRDPCVHLHSHNVQTAVATRRKVRATIGGPSRMPWATRARQCCTQMDATPKGEANPIKCSLVQIEGCNSPSWRWNS